MLRLFRFIKNFYVNDTELAIRYSIVIFIFLGAFNTIWYDGYILNGMLAGMLLHSIITIFIFIFLSLSEIIITCDIWLYIKDCWIDSKLKEK